MIRGILTILSSTILLISLIVMGVSWDLSSSLNYNQVQNQAVNLFPLIDQKLNISQALNNKLPIIKEYCISNPDFIFSYQGYVFDISCANVNKEESAIINNTIKSFVGSLYYKQYNCNYWDCFYNLSSPFFLISEKSENYWTHLFYTSVTVSILLAGILFLFVKKKRNFPLLIGSTVIISSLPLLGIKTIISKISNTNVSKISSLFFSQSNTIFIIMVIIGILFLFGGLVIELFEAESKIYKFFSREKKISPNK